METQGSRLLLSHGSIVPRSLRDFLLQTLKEKKAETLFLE